MNPNIIMINIDCLQSMQASLNRCLVLHIKSAVFYKYHGLAKKNYRVNEKWKRMKNQDWSSEFKYFGKTQSVCSLNEKQKDFDYKYDHDRMKTDRWIGYVHIKWFQTYMCIIRQNAVCIVSIDNVRCFKSTNVINLRTDNNISSL